ncbi:MAG: GPP34 family phosphoprotein [Bacteroidota bacterium]
MELLLHEAYLLLGIDDEKGHFTDYSGFYGYGFVTAILLDMIEQGVLDIEDKRVVIKSSNKTVNKTFNRALEVTKKFKKPQKLGNWINYMMAYSSKLYRFSLDRLIRQQILKQTYWKLLWVFKIKRYPTRNGQPERELIQRLRQIVLQGEQGSRQDRQLLKLLQVSKQLKAVFADKAARKNAEQFIKAMPPEGAWGEAFEQAIKEVEAAMVAAMMG